MKSIGHHFDHAASHSSASISTRRSLSQRRSWSNGLPCCRAHLHSLTSVVEHAVHDNRSTGDRLRTVEELNDTVREIDHHSAGGIGGEIAEITHMATGDIVGACSVRPV